MKSNQYWVTRAENSILYAEDNADAFYKQIKKVYDGTMKSIQEEIENYHVSYGMAYTDSLKSLNVLEVAQWRKWAKNSLKIAENGNWDSKYITKIKKLSKRIRISRLESLKEQINFNMQELYESELKAYKKELPQQYLDSYYQSNYTLQNGTGIGYIFQSPADTYLKTIINYKFLETNFSSAVWGRKKKNLLKVEQLLPQGMIQGKNPRVIAKEIQKAVGGKDAKYSDCERLARTEFNLIANKATEDTYKESGLVEEYKYVATLDNRTSSICASMDGEIIPLKEAEVGVNYPPLHPYCRSTTVISTDEAELSERIAKDKTGKYYYVKSDMTFKEWFKNLDDEHQKQFKNISKSQRKRFMEG